MNAINTAILDTQGVPAQLLAKKPNLFIVGAPKCGTNSMHSYLGQHPEIFMSRIKEPRFLCPDLIIRADWRSPNFASYLSLFQGATSEKWRGEASPFYLYSSTAAGLIKELEPEARIIMMLRNPVDMVCSFHFNLVNNGHEDLVELKEAIEAEEERRKGRRIPDHTPLPKCHAYLDFASFSSQIERYFETFDRDRIHIVLFDDLSSDVCRVYRAVLEFLAVDPEFVPDYEPKKVSRTTTPLDLQLKRMLSRVPRLQHFVLKKFPEPLLKAYRALIVRVGKRRSASSIEPELRAWLYEYFQPEIARLSVLLERDLSHWSKPRGN